MGAAPYGQLAVASRSGFQYTMNSTYTSNTVPTIFTTNCYNYRIVCWGIHISVMSPVPNTGGTIVLSTLDQPIPVGGFYTSGTMDATEVAAFSLVSGGSYLWVSKPVGRDRTFINQSTSTVIAPNGGVEWTSLFIDLYGAVASSTTIDIEYVYNIEFVGVPASGLSHLSPDDPPASMAAIDKAAEVQRKVPSAHSGMVDDIRARLKAEARKAALRAGESALEGVANLFV